MESMPLAQIREGRYVHQVEAYIADSRIGVLIGGAVRAWSLCSIARTRS